MKQANMHNVESVANIVQFVLCTGDKLPPLSPLKANCSPQPAQREKISWRTSQVDRSCGWGSGKRRNVRK